MICIYHSRDLDGFSSGGIVKHKFPDAKLIGYDYGQPIPYDQIPAGEAIVMVDVSLPMPEMEKLAKHSGWKFTWIDHHASAIKDYNEYIGEGESFCTAILIDGIAACEITWGYFFPNEPKPLAILLLGEYDTWRKQDADRWENVILPFQFGMRMDCNSPETFDKDLFDSTYYPNHIIERGKTVLKYQAQVNKIQCAKAFVIENFHGYRAICLNIGGANSDAFRSVYDKDKHDIMMTFQYTGKDWNYSLYSDKPEIDASIIAKSYGGGGHKAACGWKTKDLLTELTQK